MTTQDNQNAEVIPAVFMSKMALPHFHAHLSSPGHKALRSCRMETHDGVPMEFLLCERRSDDEYEVELTIFQFIRAEGEAITVSSVWSQEVQFDCDEEDDDNYFNREAFIDDKTDAAKDTYNAVTLAVSTFVGWQESTMKGGRWELEAESVIRK